MTFCFLRLIQMMIATSKRTRDTNPPPATAPPATAPMMAPTGVEEVSEVDGESAKKEKGEEMGILRSFYWI